MDETAVWGIAEWLAQTLKLMVDKPYAVAVVPVPQPSGAVLIVTVDKSDIGKVVGKMGRTARSIRIVLSAMGLKEGIRVGFDLRQG
jgi:uncharacterized protein